MGSHPTEDGQIEVYAGRYGPYVQHGKIRATLPKSVEPEALTLEEALELLSTKAAKDVPAKKTTVKKASVKKPAATKKVSTAKASTGKTATEKTSATKTATKKTSTKKPASKKADS